MTKKPACQAIVPHYIDALTEIKATCEKKDAAQVEACLNRKILTLLKQEMPPVLNAVMHLKWSTPEWNTAIAARDCIRELSSDAIERYGFPSRTIDSATMGYYPSI